MKKIITFILFALLLLPLEGQIGRYPFYRVTVADTLGPELLTNGGFDTDTAWTKGTGWTIDGGNAIATNVAQWTSIYQYLFTPESGDKYYVEVYIVDYTSGTFNVGFAANYVNIPVTEDGLYSCTITINGAPNQTFLFRNGSSTAANYKVNSISMKKILE